MKRKMLIAIPLTTIAALAVAGVAQAHNATATATCSQLSWSAWNYDKTVVNTIVVKVNGTTIHADLDFKSSDEGIYPWDQTQSHTWSVVIDAPGTQYDRSLGGTQVACVAATTTTVVEATTTVPITEPTTTVADTTTTVVAVGIPPVPTTVPPSSIAQDVMVLTPDNPVLPATGGMSNALIVVAIGFVIVGVFLVVRGRRVP